MAKKKTKQKPKPIAKHRGSENLIHWKPGQSGNPSGPPIARLHLKTRAFKFAQLTKPELEHRLEHDKALLVADRVAIRWVLDAHNGKWPQMQELLNRDDGKVADRAVVASVDLTMTPDEAAEVLGILKDRENDDVGKK